MFDRIMRNAGPSGKITGRSLVYRTIRFSDSGEFNFLAKGPSISSASAEPSQLNNLLIGTHFNPQFAATSGCFQSSVTTLAKP
jgi:hypothetical protein